MLTQEKVDELSFNSTLVQLKSWLWKGNRTKLG